MENIEFKIVYCVLINVIAVLLGYRFLKNKNIYQSWIMLILSLIIIDIIFLHDNPIIRMLAIIVTTFTCMKVVAAAETYKYKRSDLTFLQWVSFSGWAGMRVQLFETFGQKPLPNAWPMIRFGISRLLIGSLFILLAHIIVSRHLANNLTYFSVSVLLLIGLSLILHFGLLSISAGMWRLSGVNTYMLFRQPAKARSLTEFWSKRWNLAFSEMTSITIFRPLKKITGNTTALISAFIFSGILHELALSLPVNSGYGLPLLYFLIQGLLVLFERVLINYKVRILDNNLFARMWTLFWVIAPMPLLFHEQFINKVVWPLAGLKV